MATVGANIVSAAAEVEDTSAADATTAPVRTAADARMRPTGDMAQPQDALATTTVPTRRQRAMERPTAHPTPQQRTVAANTVAANIASHSRPKYQHMKASKRRRLTAPPLCISVHCRALNPLLSERAVPVNPSALKESVTHHAVAKQKKDDCQKDYEQEVSTSEGRRLWVSRVRRIQ